ncbi:MAG: phosphoadenylyl-sulfate reductase [Alphaproteobacteria bacterium]|nr:MAG: phosphoadenylyl-sulfate reductase [Alphaproteobacteria bacterium]
MPTPHDILPPHDTLRHDGDFLRRDGVPESRDHPHTDDSYRLARARRRAAVLSWRYAGYDGAALLRAMIEREFPGRIAVVSSFGAESAVLLDLVARVDPTVPVIFLDTGKHFDETLSYRDEVTARLGLRDVRSVTPEPAVLARRDPHGQLWRLSPDHCCHLRKVLPLRRALAGFDAWITGRKRYQGGVRTDLPCIEAADGWVKINPLAPWSAAQIAAAFRDSGLPRHPLADDGYPSIGCAPCTRRVRAGEPVRAGRWAGTGKTECGIHWPSPAGAPGRPEEDITT